MAQLVKAVLAPPMVIGPEQQLPGELRVLRAAERSLTGERRGLRAVLPFLGPALIAAAPYVHPGDLATNMAGGAPYPHTPPCVVPPAAPQGRRSPALGAQRAIPP